jgi:nucleotide-binding universal stress UspA family protein
MKILVAHDGSPQADKALETAVRMASGLGGTVDVVTVVQDLCLSTEEISLKDCEAVDASLAAEARGRMKKVSDALAAKGVAATMVVKNGRPAEGIVEAAGELGSDLIVVGSHGRHGAARMLLGSVSSRVAALAGVNTLIVK